MARATNSPASRKRRKKVLKYAKGYFGSKSKLFRYAKEAVQHAWQYAYAARRKKKGDFRGLWIVRLNAACRNAGISYSRFIEGLKAAGIGLIFSKSITRSVNRETETYRFFENVRSDVGCQRTRGGSLCGCSCWNMCNACSNRRKPT